jgi:hypothetical protein
MPTHDHTVAERRTERRSASARPAGTRASAAGSPRKCHLRPPRIVREPEEARIVRLKRE